MARSLDSLISESKHILARFDAVKNIYPDAFCPYGLPRSSKERIIFASKTVNQNYTHFDFITTSYSLKVSPYCEIDFEFDNKKEVIKVHSTPKTSRLLHIQYNFKTRQNIICFSRLAFNMERNNIKDDMMAECRQQILNFIQKYPNCMLDKKHIDSRIEKLLAFI